MSQMETHIQLGNVGRLQLKGPEPARYCSGVISLDPPPIRLLIFMLNVNPPWPPVHDSLGPGKTKVYDSNAPRYALVLE